MKDIAIYDIYGRAVRQQVNKTTGQQVIDVADLETGIYFINIKTNNGNIVKRLIKNWYQIAWKAYTDTAYGKVIRNLCQIAWKAYTDTAYGKVIQIGNVNIGLLCERTGMKSLVWIREMILL